MTRGAAEQGAQVVAISCGGELERIALDAGGLHIACREGFLPRAAIGALVAPLCTVLYRMGLAPGAQAMLLRAQTQLARRRDQCCPQIEGAANPARELARQIGRTIPLIYGGGAIGAVAAYRWKCDVNENAKAPALSRAYPELDHNEICAWGQHGDVTRQLITLVELRHGFEHPRLRLRFEATREIIDECVHQVLSVEAEGEGRLGQLLDLMYMGDWTSCYLPLQNDVDPGAIDAIFAVTDRMPARATCSSPSRSSSRRDRTACRSLRASSRRPNPTPVALRRSRRACDAWPTTCPRVRSSRACCRRFRRRARSPVSRGSTSAPGRSRRARRTPGRECQRSGGTTGRTSP